MLTGIKHQVIIRKYSCGCSPCIPVPHSTDLNKAHFSAKPRGGEQCISWQICNSQLCINHSASASTYSGREMLWKNHIELPGWRPKKTYSYSEDLFFRGDCKPLFWCQVNRKSILETENMSSIWMTTSWQLRVSSTHSQLLMSQRGSPCSSPAWLPQSTSEKLSCWTSLTIINVAWVYLMVHLVLTAIGCFDSDHSWKIKWLYPIPYGWDMTILEAMAMVEIDV